MTVETRPSIPAPPDPLEHARGGARAERDTLSIIVNGRRHVVGSAILDHEDIVRLAFPATGTTSFLVTFRKGPLDLATGFLVPGHGTPIVEDQVFHVAAAVQS